MTSSTIRCHVGRSTVRIQAPGGETQSFHDDTGDTMSVLRSAVTSLPADSRRRAIDVCIHGLGERLFMLPWTPLLTTESRWDTYARSRLELIHGDSARWAIQWLLQRPGRPRLAAAVPDDALDGLRQVFADRLGQVQLSAVSVLQRELARDRRFTGAVCGVHTHEVQMILVVDGVPQRVRHRRANPADHAWMAVLAAEWAVLRVGSPALEEQIPVLILTGECVTEPGQMAAISGARSLRMEQ
jgi:hypothetical protein